MLAFFAGGRRIVGSNSHLETKGPCGVPWFFLTAVTAWTYIEPSFGRVSWEADWVQSLP